MASNIEELKRKFYMNQYDNYLNYLRFWDYRDKNNEYCIHLKRVFESNYESKFSKTKKEEGKVIHYHHAVTDLIANESQQWASIDEFFDIISRDASITKHVNDLVDYINSKDLKNESETRTQSEDSIIKLIANYFCEQNGIEDKPITKSKNATRDNEYIEIKSEHGITPITDPEQKKLYTIKENVRLKDELKETSTFFNAIDVIEKHLFFRSHNDSLDWNLSNSVKYLKAVKDLRNNQFHHVVEMIKEHDANPVVVLRFVLFTYIHVVLALRMSMVRWGKGNYPQSPVTLRVHLNDGSWESLGVRLYRIDRNKEVEVKEVPSNSERTKTYKVYRFNEYEIRVNGGASESLKIGPKCFNPLAVADKTKPRFYQSETEATSSDHKLFSGDYYDETLTNLKGINENTGEIRDDLTIIKDVITDRVEEQRIAEKIAAEKKAEEEEAARKKAEEEEEAKRIAEEARKKAEEEAAERKRRCRLRILSGIIGILLMAATAVFVWCYVTDNSLIWIKHKTPIICLVVLLIILYLSSLIGYFYLYKECKVKKIFVPLCLSVVFALLLGGSYRSIPLKKIEDFIVKYDFSTHDKGDNANAAEIIENYLVNDKTNDVATTKLLNYYINIEKDSVNIDKAVVLSKQVVDNISFYPKSSVYAAYAFFKKANFSDDKKLYAPINFIFDNYKELSSELACLKGIMTVYGLGVERNVQEGTALLKESADKGNSKAQYYLGFVYSRDLTDWAAYRKGKKIIPFNNINLYWAIYYLKEAAKNRPEAMLELANIYSDLNLTGKASAYYKMTIDNSDGEILKSAYFKMGLLQERLGNEHNEFLTKAIESAYGPAILHKAKKEKDHVKLIGYYLSTSQSQKTYIPPIVFDYLYEAEFDNALKTLQTAHVNGGFDMNFINGMKYLLGITVDKDSIIGNEYMKKSANNGCVFAKMMWEFRKQESNPQFQFSCFNEYCNEIPFAHVLRSWLLAKRGDMFQAQPEAMKAISLGHPAGAYMLKYTEYKGFKLLDKWQMAFRALPNTMNKQDCVNFGFYYDYIFYFHLNQRPIPSELLEFWEEIAIENHCFDAECRILGCLEMSNEELSDDNYRRLLEAALVDAKGMVPPSTLTFIAFKINEIPSFNEQLKLKYQYEPHIQEILSITPGSRYYQVEKETGKPSLWLLDLEKKMNLPNITDWQILNELSDTGNNYLDYYPM